MRETKLRNALTVMLLFCAARGMADFAIAVNFADGMNESYKTAFNDAAAFWESQITGYRTDSQILQGISISAEVAANDGVGGILGSAGPTGGWYLKDFQLTGDTAPSDVLYSAAGAMTFDSADVDNLIAGGDWENVIRHEMAHVLGFGTLWGIDDLAGTVYNDFYVAGSGQYTGAAGLAAYRNEFDPEATFVPVELGGGSGTADGHWNEIDGGALLTGIIDAAARDLRDELMTGWLNPSSFVSQTTLGQFYDMGYTVIPEPSSFLLILVSAITALAIRRHILM